MKESIGNLECTDLKMKPLCVSKELQLPVEEGLIMDCGFSMTLENDDWLGRCACELYNFFDFFPA